MCVSGFHWRLMNSKISVFALHVPRSNPTSVIKSTPALWLISQSHCLTWLLQWLATKKTKKEKHWLLFRLVIYVGRFSTLRSLENVSRTHRPPVIGYLETVWKFSVCQFYPNWLYGHADINLRRPAKAFSIEVQKKFHVRFAKKTDQELLLDTW